MSQHLSCLKPCLLFIDAADIGAEADELRDQVIITAVNMVDVANLRLTLCHETREDHRRTSAQIRCLDLAAIKFFHALDKDVRPSILMFAPCA